MKKTNILILPFLPLESTTAFKIIISKATRKRPIGKPSRRWNYNIETNLREIGVKVRNWINSTLD